MAVVEPRISVSEKIRRLNGTMSDKKPQDLKVDIDTAPHADNLEAVADKAAVEGISELPEPDTTDPPDGPIPVAEPDSTVEDEPPSQSPEPLHSAAADATKQDESAPDDASVKSRSSTLTSESNGPAKLPKSGSARNLGFTGMLPSIPWGPTSPSRSTEQLPPPLTKPSLSSRKISSPFSWLSRAKDQAPPPLPTRSVTDGGKRDTSAVSPELMMSKMATAQRPSSPPGHDSLRDRFKELRLRGETTAVDLPDGLEQAPFDASITGAGVLASSTSGSDKEIEQTPLSPISVSLSTGTEDAVNWDLWQAVVYEGPAAVARTSSEELNRAIAAGIPSAIRGVVWQVMAQSKNEDLEGVYRDLTARSGEQDRTSASSATSAPLTKVDTNGKETVSDVSSVYSDLSSPLDSNGKVIDPMDVDSEALSKEQAAKTEQRRLRLKADKAAIQKLEKTIRRDLGARTSYSKYAAAEGLQEGLFGVCKAYALFDEAVGYAQGMNFLAMPLLFNMPEEEAFCMLVRLMNQYGLRQLFVEEMPGLHLHLYQFERLLEDLEPAVYCHLHRRNVTPQLYATQWFLTLFAYRFPLQLVLRIYDLLLSEGLEGAILKFGIVLMQRNREALLKMNDMSSLTNFLKEKIFDVYIDRNPSSASLLESGFFGSSGGSDKEVYRADELVQDACAVKITPEMLKLYTAEWEEKNRLEKEREFEIETLRSNNVKLIAQVRTLQNHNENLDKEHILVASDLVKHKVENEELKDHNESLSGQVVELRSVIDKQAADVYEKLKDEMDSVMKRNLAVHNSNRQLESAMGEMEKDMVNAKMELAEVSEKHETLKLRWSELRKALDD